MKIIDKYNKKVSKIKLKETKLYQKILDNKVLFDDMKVNIKIKDDCQLFYYEVLLYSFLIKLKIEESYALFRYEDGDMYKTLNYSERRVIFNQNLHPILENKPHFISNDNLIYMPIYNEDINNWYYDDFQIFELKKHKEELDHTVISHESMYNLYKYNVYKSDISSLVYINENDNVISFFSNDLNTLYFFNKNDFMLIDEICFNKDDKISNDDLSKLSLYYLNKEYKNIFELLLNNHLIDEKFYKKIIKKIERMN